METKTSLYSLVDNANGERELVISPHIGQVKILQDERRFQIMLAGSGGGKTSLLPVWMYNEILRCGSGDYLAVSPTFPLQNLRLIPAFIDFFVTTLKIGEFKIAKRVLEIHGKTPDGELNANIFFGSAEKAESLESAVANAVCIDEAGQDKFKLSAWEAILRRVGHREGRVLITTCYDEKTEIYTESGWKLIGDLTDTDKVYAPNENGIGDFEVPYRRTWEHYKGKMLHFTGGRIDLCVTPNHRILYKNHSRFYINDAEHFSKLNRRFLTIPKLINPHITDKKYFNLPSVVIGHRWGNDIINNSDIKIPMGDWCAFMGWFLSEGCVTGCKGGSTANGKYHIICSQSMPEKWQKMKDDLDKLPFKWHKEGISYVTGDKQLWSYLKDLGNSYQKYIPKELKRAGKNNLLILIDRMILGDGSNITSGNMKYFKYYTTSKQLADDFREVCMLSGVSTGMQKRASQPFQGTTGNFKPIYHIWQRKRKSGIAETCEEIDYDGNIGCVGTSTGLVFVRRNGEECISGNTLYNFGWLKRELYDRWVNGDPDINVVQFDSIENPYYSKTEYERARRMLPAWKFNMQYRGRYDRPAGLIYSDMDENIHLIPSFHIPQSWNWHVGIDPGAVHTALVWVAEEPATNKYFIAKSYLDGNKTTKEHVKKAKQQFSYGQVIRWVGGAGSEDQFRMDWTNEGIHVREPEIRDVEAGIDRVTALLREKRLFIFNTEENQPLIEEFRSYSRELDEQGQPTDKIKDKNKFHLEDACRYVFSGMGNMGDYSTAVIFQGNTIPIISKIDKVYTRQDIPVM
jgi:hypothetical protein